ncbi:hypothetical protein JOB18_018395 [Solea senegalensis]|uniref:Uncharacterized protein n=1 Tax=Solea senegalensis TaxID=28829 RepID=A0AAV6S7P1_SOLSE|nr:hypothetical protein JOB18_018395 [Solea senegalensis]
MLEELNTNSLSLSVFEPTTSGPHQVERSHPQQPPQTATRGHCMFCHASVDRTEPVPPSESAMRRSFRDCRAHFLKHRVRSQLSDYRGQIRARINRTVTGFVDVVQWRYRGDDMTWIGYFGPSHYTMTRVNKERLVSVSSRCDTLINTCPCCVSVPSLIIRLSLPFSPNLTVFSDEYKMKGVEEVKYMRGEENRVNARNQENLEKSNVQHRGKQKEVASANIKSNIHTSESQQEFFRMLDEKIEKGRDYCSEEEEEEDGT